MINKVELIGRLTKDVEKKMIGSGSIVANVSVVTTENVKKQDGTWEEKPEFHNVTLWNKAAEFAEKYCKKGDLVRVEGKVQTDKYDKNGETRYSTKIVGRDFKKLVWEKKAEQQGQSQGQVQKTQQGQPEELKEDDIPF